MHDRPVNGGAVSGAIWARYGLGGLIIVGHSSADRARRGSHCKLAICLPAPVLLRKLSTAPNPGRLLRAGASCQLRAPTATTATLLAPPPPDSLARHLVGGGCKFRLSVLADPEGLGKRANIHTVGSLHWVSFEPLLCNSLALASTCFGSQHGQTNDSLQFASFIFTASRCSFAPLNRMAE